MKTYNTRTVQMAFAQLLANEPNISRTEEKEFLTNGICRVGDTLHCHDPYNLLG